MPIRVSSIRGHLRFWWRATRGAKFDTVEELRQREGEIWGSMENPSPVNIEVLDLKCGDRKPCAYYIWRQKNNGKWVWALEWAKEFMVANRSLPYALFPFQGERPGNKDPDKTDRPQAETMLSGTFTLVVKCPSVQRMGVFRPLYNEQREKKGLKLLNDSHDAIEEDVITAVWAWVNFGGIGARTRRGCGALYCQDLATQDFANIGGWYSGCLKKLGISTATSREWPTLPEKILIKKGTSADALQCWSDVIGLLQTFRQGVNVGRNLGAQGYPGRSRWPEPETIRTVTNRRSNIRKRIEQIPNDAFPRAELGLPIIFHFKDGGDPADTELSPVVGDEEKTRMASPLILRPLRCKNGDMLQMILQLNSPRVDEVVLEEAPGTPRFTKIRDPGLASYPKSPMGSASPRVPMRSSAGSALDAFINFAQEQVNGFTEVPR